jgi:hypothetical protein
MCPYIEREDLGSFFLVRAGISGSLCHALCHVARNGVSRLSYWLSIRFLITGKQGTSPLSFGDHKNENYSLGSPSGSKIYHRLEQVTRGDWNPGDSHIRDHEPGRKDNQENERDHDRNRNGKDCFRGIHLLELADSQYGKGQ